MSYFVFGIGIILSQFYFYKSGIPQPSHYLMIFPLIWYFVSSRRFIITPANQNVPKILMIFFIYSLIVNSIYFVIYEKNEFLWSSFYVFYGLLVFLLVQNLSLNKLEGLNSISFYAFIGLLVLLVIGVFGYGEYKFYPRYNGYFNDPNQMAFWVLCVLSIVIVNKSGGLLVKGVAFFCGFYLILLTASRSGSIGFLFVLVGFLLNLINNISKLSSLQKSIFMLSVFVGILFFVFFINSELMLYLMSRVDEVDVSAQADTRGYARIINFPEYLLTGSGQGYDDRFVAVGTEIHSTWVGLLFYYGVLGLMLICVVVYMIMSKLELNEKIIFMGPLFYGFTTYGLRTPIVWVFIGFFYSLGLLQKRSNVT